MGVSHRVEGGGVFHIVGEGVCPIVECWGCLFP